jgi:hypothetical protein
VANRKNPNNGTALPAADPLQSLMDTCYRNGRKGIVPPKPEKIYFDADRFRWLLAQPNPAATLAELQAFYGPHCREVWRQAFDASMHAVKWEYEA